MVQISFINIKILLKLINNSLFTSFFWEDAYYGLSLEVKKWIKNYYLNKKGLVMNFF